MVAALFCVAVGTALGLYIGVDVLGHSVSTVLISLLVSNIAGFLSVTLAMVLQEIRVIKKYLIPTVSRTWVVFLMVYFSATWAMLPAVFTLKDFVYMLAPFILVTGIAIIIFGPLQDMMVRRRQLKARQTTSSRGA